MEKGKDAFLSRVHILLNAVLNAEPLELGADQFVACLFVHEKKSKLIKL